MDRLQKLALWHQVSSADYLGPIRFRTLWENLRDDIGRIFQMSDTELLKFKGAITKQNVKGIREQADRYEKSLDFMRRQLEAADKYGGQILTLDDPQYPEPLRKSKMSHAIIYCVGQVGKFARYDKAIAIVGTRKAAQQSLTTAYEVARDLAAKGWVIVSGLAKGIDSAAHKGALDAGGKTIAVVGCGPDFIYPPDSRDLYERIRADGLILSEFAFGTKPEDWKLKKRNKTTVALATAVFIVETGARGGTMNAVKSCREQHKRPCVLLPTWSCDRSGNVKAIEDGGVLVSPMPDLPSVLAVHVDRAQGVDKTLDVGGLLAECIQGVHASELFQHANEFHLNDSTYRIRVYLLQEGPAVYRVVGEKLDTRKHVWTRVYEKGHVCENLSSSAMDESLIGGWVQQARAKIETRTRKRVRKPTSEDGLSPGVLA